jgi:hypothetical protein
MFTRQWQPGQTFRAEDLYTNVTQTITTNGFTVKVGPVFDDASVDSERASPEPRLSPLSMFSHFFQGVAAQGGSSIFKLTPV